MSRRTIRPHAACLPFRRFIVARNKWICSAVELQCALAVTCWAKARSFIIYTAKSGNRDQREEDASDTELVSQLWHPASLIYVKKSQISAQAIEAGSMGRLLCNVDRRDVGEVDEKRNSIFFANSTSRKCAKHEHTKKLDQQPPSSRAQMAHLFEVKRRRRKISHLCECRLSS